MSADSSAGEGQARRRRRRRAVQRWEVLAPQPDGTPLALNAASATSGLAAGMSWGGCALETTPGWFLVTGAQWQDGASPVPSGRTRAGRQRDQHRRTEPVDAKTPHRADLAAGRHASCLTVLATRRPAIGRPSPRTSPASSPAHSRPTTYLPPGRRWPRRHSEQAAYHPAVERVPPTVAQHAADVSGVLAPHGRALGGHLPAHRAGDPAAARR